VLNHAVSGRQLFKITPTPPALPYYYLNFGGGAVPNEYLDSLSTWATFTSAPEVPWQSVPSASDVREVAARYRPVSGGMRVRYTGPALTAAGVIAAAPIPTDLASTGLEINYEFIEALEGAVIVPAIDGIDARMVPTNGAPKYRPVKMTHNYIDHVNNVPPYVNFAFQDFTTCDTDPDYYNALHAPAAVTFVGGPGCPFVSNPPTLAQEIIPNGASGDGVECLFFNYACLQTQCSVLSSDMTSVMIYARGLPTSVNGVLEAEVVLNIELVADTRSFVSSTVDRSRRHVSNERGDVARSVASALPSVSKTTGDAALPKIARNTKSQRPNDSLMKSLSSAAEMTTETLSGAFDAISEATGPVLDTVLDVLPFVATLL
jgi:hypothetical protein